MGTPSDPTLKLAVSIQSNPGVYAVLLGSGVSKPAGIFTGWQIVLDLVRKVAELERTRAEPDPETWYRKRFGESPTYPKVLERVANTQAERMGLLRPYFEPTDDEREKGLKVPTPAHRALAKLVKLGYVRAILTTNFDRLIEDALREGGVTPDVIASEDELKGTVPPIHLKHFVVKLNGDYRDTRIKNTPEELSSYPEALDRFLERIFDEFGLIVCGWSGEWDTALRNAILRCQSRRFTMFWAAKGEMKDEAKRLTEHRPSEIIRIDSADAFFTDLFEKVKSLDELGRPDPLGVEVAVATVKRFLIEPRDRVRLHDLILDETGRVFNAVASEAPPDGCVGMKEGYQPRIQKFTALVEQLLPMLAALAYHDEGGNSSLLTLSVERLAQVRTRAGQNPYMDLQLFPALLALYVSGIAALAAKRYNNLAAVLRAPKYADPPLSKKIPVLGKLNAPSVFSAGCDRYLPGPDATTAPDRASNYLHDRIRPFLKDYIVDDHQYTQYFDGFEYIMALTFMDIVSTQGFLRGRYCQHYGVWYGMQQLDYPEGSIMGEFQRVGLDDISPDELLSAGFFRGRLPGDPNIRFNEIVKLHYEIATKSAQRHA